MASFDRHRRRVILVPFNFATRPGKTAEDTDCDRRSGDLWKNLAAHKLFPKRTFECRFDEFIREDAEIYKIHYRQMAGFFLIKVDADMADPGSDLIVIWNTFIRPNGYHTSFCVFYVDGEFWAGDITDDNRLDFDIHEKWRFSVRLLFRVRQNPRYEHLVLNDPTTRHS